MKKYILTIIAISFCSFLKAQNQYDAVEIASGDLNGTARYVGMGGALDALGGDVSVISSNPAGSAIFKKSDVSFTAGILFTGENGQLGKDNIRASFDQAGMVFTLPEYNSSSLKYINFGLNYQKKRNFFSNQNTNINLDGVLSQTNQFADFINAGRSGMISDIAPTILNYDDINNKYLGAGATNANYRKSLIGYINQYDLNVSFNLSNQFFLGMSLGIYDLSSKRDSYYMENRSDMNVYDISSWYDTDGTGYDLKFGFICRPVKESPFRFGITIHTPTWYRLTDIKDSGIMLNDNERIFPDDYPSEYEYDYRTPWKFGLSLGHTVGNNFAFGAQYEISDMSTSRYSSLDFENSDYFSKMNDYIRDHLKTQHTLRLGLEYKPIQNLALRCGYNYISSPIKDGARKSSDVGYSCETDYVNWKGTNRFTLGIGYRYKGGYFDVAYQYQTQKGDFYAFTDENLKSTDISNNRNQIMATLGFRF